MDNKFISILFIIFLGIALILSKIPRLNPPDMFTRDVTLKGALKLFLISLAAFILIMIIVVSFLMYTSQ